MGLGTQEDVPTQGTAALCERLSLSYSLVRYWTRRLATIMSGIVSSRKKRASGKQLAERSVR